MLREVDNVEGLGIADIDKDGRIQRFVEKPLPKDAPSNLANTGLYVMSPEVRKIFKEKGVQQIIKEKNRLRLRLRLYSLRYLRLVAQFMVTRLRAAGLMWAHLKATWKP